MSGSTTDAPSEAELSKSELPRFSITIDGAYAREHWAEMVATRLPNTRMARRYSVLFGLLAVLLLQPFWILPDWMPQSRTGSLIIAALCLFMGGTYLWKRHLWLSMAKRHPRFGQEVDFLIRGGEIVQHPRPSEPGLELSGATLHGTPRGYLIRGALPEDHGLGPKFEQTASVYLPHRSLEPPISREEFTALACIIHERDRPVRPNRDVARLTTE